MKYLDRIEVGCNAIVGGIAIFNIVDTIIGESGNRYFACTPLYGRGFHFFRAEELERPFVWEEGEPYGLDQGNA